MQRFMRFKSVLLLVVLALVIASCGDDAEEQPATTAAPEAPATTAAPEEPEAPATTAAEAPSDTDDEPEPEPETTTTTAAPPPPPEPVTVRAAVTGDEGTLNPYTYISGFPGWNLLMLQYDSLMQLDAAGVPQPWLASSVSVSADLTEWSVTLVEGVTFHDGEPLTSDDVAFSVEFYTTNPEASRFARDFRGVADVVVHDDYNVTFVLESANPGFDVVALADAPIIPRHIWESVELPSEHQFAGGTNIGSGPYMLTEYVDSQSYRFAANPNYFRGAPAVDELVVIVFADDAGAQAAIRTGEVDVIFERIPPEQIDLLDSQDPLDVILGPEFATQMINYDASIRPFDDVAVRQAINLAMDRQDIVDTVYLGAATVGSPGWIHPGHSVYNPGIEVDVYDPAAANALLDGAGYADSDGDGVREYDGQPMSFEIITNASDSLRLRIAELTVEMLAAIGIETEVLPVDTGVWENAVWPGFDVNNGRNYQIAMWGWSPPVQADPLRLPWLVHSSLDRGFLNLTGYGNAEMDELSEALAVEPDPAQRKAILGRMQEIIAEDLPFVLLLYPDGAYVYDSSVYADWEFIAGQGIVSKLSLLPPSARP